MRRPADATVKRMVILCRSSGTGAVGWGKMSQNRVVVALGGCSVVAEHFCGSDGDTPPTGAGDNCEDFFSDIVGGFVVWVFRAGAERRRGKKLRSRPCT